MAAGAPTPLLPFYQERWSFPAAILTLAFAVYAIGFLVAMLTVGSLSDHVGRRPMLIGALLVQLLATVTFLVAPGIGWVIAARVLQGLATGAATSAFTATLSGFIAPATAAVVAVASGRLSPRRGMTIGIYASIAGTIGVVTGVLAGSLAVMITGLVITGIGFGAAFSGSMRLIVPLAGPQQRAGIVAAIYVVAYIAFGLPVIIAGQLAAPLGLMPTVAGYGGATVALALISLISQFRTGRGPHE